MAVYNGPPRGGSRGGRDQFNWDAVKGDKDREYYLGHSVKALTGRWQKGKDVYWYTRDKNQEESTAAMNHELQAVKDKEAQLMAEALGLKAPETKRSGPQLDQNEMNKLLEKTRSTDADAMAVKGLGYAPRAMGGLPAAHERLPADGLPGAACHPLPQDLPDPPPGGPTEVSHKRSRLRDDSPERSTKRRNEHSSKKSKKDRREKKEKKHKREKKHSKDKKRIRRSESP